MKIKWGLIDKDERFINNFKVYIQTYHNHEIDLYSYSDGDKFNRFEDNNKLDVIVISEDCIKDVEIPKACNTAIVLTMSETASGEGSNYCFVSRFGSSKEIVEKTLAVYYERNRLRNIDLDMSGNSEITVFYSPIGGAGKTVLSLLYGKLLANRGKNVLYISFDQYLDLEAMLSSSNKPDITYLLASYGEAVVLDDEINDIKGLDPHTGMSFIKSIERYKDIVDLDEKNDSYWNWFVAALASMKTYDNVVLDIPTDLNGKHMDMLDIASRVYVVLNEGTIERSKANKFRSQLGSFPFYEKHREANTWHYILNDAKNVSSSKGYEDLGIETRISVPFDSNLKAYNVKEERILLKLDSAAAGCIDRLIGMEQV